MFCFNFLKSRQKNEERSSPFIDNGSALLEELISSFNGRQEIPIRCFTAKEIMAATNNFANKVGHKDYDSMYRGCINERQVLVKKVDEEFNILSKGMIRDIAITSQMSHLKNVLKLSGCCLEFKKAALVYEYVEFDLLYNRLYCSGTSLTWRNRIQIAIGIANSVLYLHTAFERPVIYRDLKPSNVIIDQHGVAKLFDFSRSISLPHGETQVRDLLKGTIGFIEPEYMRTRYVTQKSDVFSFGVILLELVTGKKGFDLTRLKYDGNVLRDDDVLLVNHVKDLMRKDQLTQIIDPKLGELGSDQIQLQAILDLGMRCIRSSAEERPEMIHVARELRQIEKFIHY